MYWFGVLFASIGAGLILGALTYVSLLIGVLIHFMIILMSWTAGRPVSRQAGPRPA